MNSRFCSKTRQQMFLFVSVRHVGAHQAAPAWPLRASKYKYPKYSSDLNLGEGLYNVPPFISQILDFIYWTVLIFVLIYFEWRDTENHQYTL